MNKIINKLCLNNVIGSNFHIIDPLTVNVGYIRHENLSFEWSWTPPPRRVIQALLCSTLSTDKLSKNNEFPCYNLSVKTTFLSSPYDSVLQVLTFSSISSQL